MKTIILVLSLLFVVACTPPAPSDSVPTSTPKPDPAPTATPTRPTMPASLDAIKSVVVNAPGCHQYRWQDRGKAPIGYFKTMALVYARAVCQPTREDVQLMSRPKTGSGDVLVHYDPVFKKLGMKNETSEEILRHTFTVLIGLGLRESSGKYCCGRDLSANFVQSYSAESGLLQTSYDVTAAHSVLPKIYKRWENKDEGCFLSEAREGWKDVFSRKDPANPGKYIPMTWEWYCSQPAQVKTWGDPSTVGYKFQQRKKACPALDVELGAGVVRVSGGPKGHYGPLRNFAAEVLPACDKMLEQVAQTIKDNPAICDLL